MNKKVSLAYLIMALLFAMCLIVSNLLAVKQFSFFGFPATAGLITFPVSYIINDCTVEVWGYKKTRLLIWLGFALNFLAILFFQLSVALPSASFWKMQDAYASVLVQTPRIAIASLLAFLVGSFLNAYVMSRMKILHHGRKFGLRAIVSTLVGESADTAIFTTVGFLFVIPFDALCKIIVLETLLKTLYEILILPVTAKVVKYIKKAEGTDVFDEGISYNVIKIRDI